MSGYGDPSRGGKDPYADPFAEPPVPPRSTSPSVYPPTTNPSTPAPGMGQPQRYALSDVGVGYASSTPLSQSQYSFVEKDPYDGEVFRGNDDDDEQRPLREEGFAGGFYRPDGPDYGRPSPLPYGQGGPGLSRKQTSAEAWQQRQRINPRRALTKKVKLTPQGNFISEFPVPTAVMNANLSSGVEGGPTEFSHMRYTAACCDPNDFTKENGYTLRTSSYGRQTDLLVCITAYNENKILLSRTLHGLMVNIRDMVKGKFSEFRRKAESGGMEGGRIGEAWKRIVVCLVFDGIAPADKATLDVLATIGLYQDGIMKKDVDGKETVAHVFEYTTQLSMSPKPALVEPHPNDPNNLVPVQMIFVLKQKNAKKINSHRWLFNAVGKHLQPDVVCLLDAGTKPGKRSIYYLWEAFHHDKNLGGACGEIHAMLGKGGRKLLNPLVAAQNFEYKMSNVLDKPTESAFGYVSVLPGAFSCYRYSAIQGRPLTQYFHGDQTLAARLGPKGTDGMSIWTKNMFLAEDRILCFELVAKANEKWVLGYVKPAKGETDVPETAAELIGQRRRWLNGSFAAGVYSLAHFGRLYKSDHGIVRLFFLHVQAIYNTINLVMSWFAVANYFLTFSIIITMVASSLRDPKALGGQDAVCWSGSFIENDDGSSFDWLGELNWIFKCIYLIFLALQIILALGNRPKAERTTYTLSIAVYAGFALYLIFMTLILTVKAFCPIGEALKNSSGNALSVFLGSTYGPIFAGIAGTFGVYVLSSLLYLEPWHLFHSMPQFLLIAPSFTNILNVYAFCNLHDATSKKDGKDVTVEVQEKMQEDIDLTFKDTVLRAVAPFDDVEEVEKPNMDDQNKTFRTRFICFWLLCNTILALTISKITSIQSRYFQAILWITFGLSLVRIMGLLWYLVGETGQRSEALGFEREAGGQKID
ncbi:chitin synthase, glycosyltransferase family 2 protein [Pseudohyphozyma bogoriensis]|nr:chitin synthase, glycosyltransferase family 2 protein [Pseudohyphozyma bogoriensis]